MIRATRSESTDVQIYRYTDIQSERERERETNRYTGDLITSVNALIVPELWLDLIPMRGTDLR